jgi:FAD synthase
MGAVAMPEAMRPVEIAPMAYQYVTRIGSIQAVDGRVYVTLVEDQPGDEPGTTVAVVVIKLMMDADRWESAAEETCQALADMRRKRRARGN